MYARATVYVLVLLALSQRLIVFDRSLGRVRGGTE